MAHALCNLDNYGYRHTPVIFNIYCISTATMVTWTRFNFTLYVQCLSCLILKVGCTGQLKCYGTRAETRFRLSAKRTRRQFSRLLAAEFCASAVVLLDTQYSVVVWRVLTTHSIRQFPLHFPSRASPCAITFQLESILRWRRLNTQAHALATVLFWPRDTRGVIRGT
jgi:hypothetical protein